jgi:hypothetical protein
MARKSEEFERFDRAMGELLKVPHSEIKKELDAEKAQKRRRKTRKAKKPSGHGASRDSVGGT